MLFLSELARLLLAGLLTFATVATGDTVLIQEGRVVEDDLYAAGGTVFIEGEVQGDVVALASRVIVTGVVRGDVTSISGTTSVFGEVEGSVRTISATYNQDGSVADDVLAIGGRALFAGTIGGDALLYTWSADSRASIGGSVLGEVVNRLTIDGPVGAVDVGAYRLSLGANSSAEGAVAHNPGLIATYFPGLDSKVSVAEGAQTPSVLDLPVVAPPIVVRSGRWAIATLFFLSALLTGGLLIGLVPSWTARAVAQSYRLAAFLVGLASLILMPIVAFGLAITVVLIPVAVVLLAFWAVMVIGGAAPPLIRAGTRLVQRPDSIILGFVVAAVIWRLVRMVPFVGPVLWLAVASLGLGSYVMSFRSVEESLAGDVGGPIEPSEALPEDLPTELADEERD